MRSIRGAAQALFLLVFLMALPGWAADDEAEHQSPNPPPLPAPVEKGGETSPDQGQIDPSDDSSEGTDPPPSGFPTAPSPPPAPPPVPEPTEAATTGTDPIAEPSDADDADAPTADLPTAGTLPPPSSEPTSTTAPDPGPATPAPVPSPVAAPTIPRTQWQPDFDREVTMVADGSLDVCSLIALPLTIIPGVGDIVGTIGDWVCIVPAVIAIDHVSAFHGSRETHYWEPALALVLKKGWETLVDTPIIVVTVAAGIGSAASGIALFAYADTPGTVVAAGVVAVTLGVYLGLRAGRDGIGDLIFDKVYNGLVPEVGDLATADARTDSWIQPGVSGFPANFGLVATVAGSKPQFHWSHLIPVAGPVLRADAHAEGIKRRTRRYGREVMAVDKTNLAAMDDTINVLTGVQGWSNAAAHAAIITGVGFFAAGAVSSFNNPNDKTTAEILGGIGLGASAVAGVAITVGTAADKLQPIVVPLVWAAADDPLPGTPSAVPEPVPGPESVDVE